MLKPQAIFYFCGQWKIKKRKKEKRSLNPPATISLEAKFKPFGAALYLHIKLLTIGLS